MAFRAHQTIHATLPELPMTDPLPLDLPNIDAPQLHPIDREMLAGSGDPRHPPRILVLYGSIRERSYSRLLSEEAGRLLRWFGCEVKSFDPRDLPLPDGAEADHPKVKELRDLADWSEGMVWVSPERHGAMTGIMKAQIDWIPLSLGAKRPTQGKTLAVMEVSGGSQSFNAVNQMRILGRWMRMVTIPNQSSVPKAFLEFDDAGRMKPSAYYSRVVDVCEELVKFTYLVRGRSAYLTDRYSERVESAEALSERVNQRSL
ncbi:arsenical resistance protein ArsH [Fulvimarina manganoxydans]|uniref:NADPH-dependent FMN reductase ArsH n=2 Tax=Fulvimarina manganoxydans TaxID=937218 RepID=A0A1W2DGZ7_9HYPH|nr:arsenical resistance protein ArsH [Fulvimarina manganoxydans]